MLDSLVVSPARTPPNTVIWLRRSAKKVKPIIMENSTKMISLPVAGMSVRSNGRRQTTPRGREGWPLLDSHSLPMPEICPRAQNIALI